MIRRAFPLSVGPALAVALLAAGCAAPEAESPPVPAPVVTERLSDFVRVIVQRNASGLFDPTAAYVIAAARCRERTQRAVYFMGSDIGVDERMLQFRCQS